MRWKWLVAIVAAGAILVVGVQRMPFRPRTYREAVAAALDAQRVAYRDIQVGELCWPDPGYCFVHDYRRSYAAVVVYLDRPVYGRIECHYYRADCYFTLPALRLHGEPLPDVAGARPWPRNIRYIREYLKSWLRARLRRLPESRINE